MRGGFSFDGIDIAKLGLEYAPSVKDVYVHRTTASNLNEQKFDARPGSYFYGLNVQPKEFKLRCIFQDEHINEGFLTRVISVFHPGKTGRLIFDTRPWCWYNATVTSVDTNGMTNYMNGIITITLKCYYPYGRCDQKYISSSDPNERDLYRNTAMLRDVSLFTTAAGYSHSSQSRVLRLNPGTETARTGIKIKGDIGNGVIIRNVTTDTTARFHALTTQSGLYNNYTLYYDGISGRTLLTNGLTSVSGALYHDYGYIELAPAFPADRDITVKAARGATSITSSGKFTTDMIGKYIVMNNGSYYAKIQNVPNMNTITVFPTPESALNGKATIIKLNEIVVTPINGSSITYLDFDYYPTFS